jgi:hypothetical protein
LIDRVFSSKATDFDKATVEAYRCHLYGIFARFGRDDDNHPFTPATLPAYPTDHLVATFLACGDERQLARFLQEFLHECQAGAHPMYSYIYFVYCALARVQRVKVEQTKQARALLRDVKRKPKPAPAEQLNFAGDLVKQAGAAVKNLR